MLHRSEFKEATQTGFAKALLRQEHIRQREADLGHVAFIMVGTVEEVLEKKLSFNTIFSVKQPIFASQCLRVDKKQYSPNIFSTG